MFARGDDNTNNQLTIDHHVGLDVPRVASAQFSDQLNVIRVSFNGIVTLAGDTACQDLFPFNYTSFGDKATCRAVSKKIEINLLGNPTIRLGRLIVNLTNVRSSALTTIYDNCGDCQDSVSIQRPENDVMPVVQITGPTLLGSCDSLTMKAKLVGGNPGRLTYSWEVEQAPGQPNSSHMVAVLATMRSILNGLPSDTTEWTMTANQTMFTGVTVIFSVKVRNFLNTESVGTKTVLREMKELPQVQMVTSALTTKVSIPITLRVNAKVSSCLDTNSLASKLSYQWQLTPSSGVNIPNTISPLLVIPAQQLVGGRKYTATVVVAMQQDPSLSVTQTAVINTISSKVVAVIKGVQTMSILETLELSGSDSVDPDGNRGGEKVSYIWEVLNMDNSAVISRTTKKRVLLPMTQDISLNGTGNLAVGTSYKFVLKYRVGAREARAEHVVEVITCSTCIPPGVLITTTQAVFNPSSNVLIEAQITSDVGGSYEWTSVSVPDADAGGKLYGIVKGGLSSSNSLTPLKGSFKGVKNAALKLGNGGYIVGGVHYRFMLSVVDSTGIKASATYDIQANRIPAKGLFSVTPSNGEALTTEFEFKASEGWSDADGDALKFQFSYTKEDGTTFFYSPQDDNSFKTQLPTGKLTVNVRCIDTYGGYSEASAEVVVVPPTNIDVGALENQFSTLAGEQNTGQLVALASTFVSTLTQGGTELSEEQKKLQMQMTDSMCGNTDNVQTQDQKDELTHGLASSTNGGDTFTPDSISRIFAMLEFLFGIVKGGGRRRRSAVSSTPVTVKTPSEIETQLTPYNNLINPALYDVTTMSSKSNLLNALDGFTASMCKGFATGEAAGVATSNLVTIVTLNKATNDIDHAKISLGAMTGDLVLGSSLKNQYESYSCGNGASKCTSVCVSLWQMEYDLLSSSTNSSMLSSVYQIKLWNTFDQSLLAGADLSSGMEIQLSGKPTNNTYKCLSWDTVSKSWVESGVDTVGVEVININGTVSNMVTCNVTDMAYIALFEGPPPPEPITTAAPTTTTAAPTTTTAAPTTTTAAPTTTTAVPTTTTAAPTTTTAAPTTTTAAPTTTTAAPTTTTAAPTTTSSTTAAPSVTADSITLLCSGMSMMVTFDETVFPKNDTTITFPYCNETDYRVSGNTASANFSRCASNITQNGDIILMENIAKINVEAMDPTKTITRTAIYKYKLYCTFNRRLNVSSAGLKVVDDVKEFEVSSKTNFTATMEIYQSSLFTSLATPPIQVTTSEPIFIQIKSLRKTNIFKFITEECYATPTSDPNHLTQYLFFDDRCRIDMTFKEYDKNTRNQFRFSIDAFTFIRLKGQVYFHCKLLVCLRNSTTPECTQACKIKDRRRRAATSEVLDQVVVNSGAIVYKEKETCRSITCPSNSYCVDLYPAQCRCNQGYVFDTSSKRCTNNNVFIVRGLSLDMEFRSSYYDTSSTDFYVLANAVEKMLLTVVEGKFITGVKVLQAYSGSIVVDVQVSHSSRVSPREAYDYFVSSLFASQNITRVLRINQNIMPEFGLEEQVTLNKDTETTLIVAVVIVVFVLILSVMVLIIVIKRRRSKQYHITQGRIKNAQIQDTLDEGFDNAAMTHDDYADRP